MRVSSSLKQQSKAAQWFFLLEKEMAEGKGFEPPEGVSSFNDLANRRLQPLGHPSAGATRSCGPKRPHVVLKIHGVCSLFPSGDLAGCQIRKYITHPIHPSCPLTNNSHQAAQQKSGINHLHSGPVHGLFDQRLAAAKKIGQKQKRAQQWIKLPQCEFSWR